MSFQEVFREDLANDNIKIHKNSGFKPLSRKNIFGKTAARGQIDTTSRTFSLLPPAFLALTRYNCQQSKK